LTSDPNKQGTGPVEGLASGRLDRWLWCARLYKTRTLATRAVASTPVRINGVRTKKPAHSLRVGDVITLARGPDIKVLKVRAHALRRGPAAEAQALYEDLSPPRPEKATEKMPHSSSPVFRERGSGRPTKRERRKTDDLRQPQ